MIMKTSTMIEIDIPELTYVRLELIALVEGMTPVDVIDMMAREYQTKDMRELISESALKRNMRGAACAPTRTRDTK